MSNILSQKVEFLRVLSRAFVILAVMASPLAAITSIQAGQSVTIEAPSLKKKGVGFVLLMSLQRA